MTQASKIPPTPPLSPLAEVMLAFEDSDPDACALLRPLQDGLTVGHLEVRAHRMFPQWTTARRAETVARAAELLDLAAAETPPQKRNNAHKGSSPPVSAAEKERHCTRLVDALTRDPALTSAQGLALLNAEPGIAIAEGGFHGTYWKCAIDRLPPPIRRLREEMTGRRPGKGRLNLSDMQRAQVRQHVAEIKRDHPDWHAGQIMDGVRKLTAFGFQDPVAFRRNYVDVIEPAPPVATPQQSPPALALAPAPSPSAVASPVLVGEQVSAAPAEKSTGADPDHTGTAEDTLRLLLAVMDPLGPAELSPAEGGMVELKLRFRPLRNLEGYRIMRSLYGDLIKEEERKGLA